MGRTASKSNILDEDQKCEKSLGSDKRQSYFSFRLIRNCKYCQLYAEDKETFLKFLDVLRRLTVQTDFHKKYEISHFISKGSFAEVVAAEHLSTKKIYAVKVFKKEILYTKEREIQSL